jgi:hypothetical protein
MARWEVCRIVDRTGVGRTTVAKNHYLYVAFADTLNGTLVIDESPPRKNGVSEDERAKLVGRLSSQGWEPFGVNQYHQVFAFKRQVS